MEFQSDIAGQNMLIHVAIKASIRVERTALAIYLIAILFESVVKHLKPLKTITKFTKFYIIRYIYFYIIIL